MLEVTIFKAHHKGEREAKKLLKPIKECDVYSRESFGATEDEATKIEEEWRQLIGSGMSRSKFLRGLTLKSPYSRKVLEYLFIERKPIIFSERWLNLRDLEEMKRLDGLGDFKRVEGRGRIIRGDYERGIPLYQEGIKYTMESVEMRDKNIAENLERDEEILRRTYPQLQDKNNIRLIMGLGAYHKPESYTQRPIKSVPLIDENTGLGDIYSELEVLMRRGAPIDEIESLLKRNSEKG